MTTSIVLIHAVRSSRTMWTGQLKRLRSHGFQVVAPDLPGHGLRRGEPFTLEGALATIEVPITVVNGEHDPFRRHEALFLEAAREAELVILDDAGHIANLSRPKRFAKVLRRCAAAAVPA